MAIQVQQEAAPGTWEAEAATWGGCGMASVSPKKWARKLSRKEFSEIIF